MSTAKVAGNKSAIAFSRSRLDELLKKRFFVAPSFGIYGGVAGLYDYGPPGCALQTNILGLWRNHFVLEEDMLELDTAILTPHDVLKTSGHVDRFTDFMVKDSKTGDFYRADHLLESIIEKKIQEHKGSQDERDELQKTLAQLDGFTEVQLEELMQTHNVKSDTGNDLTPVVKFNLMFGADIGPTGQIKGYLRPETAQGQFTNFKRLLECNNEKMPFASAQIGKSFRNEISPRSGLLRVREFTMAEIEHFVNPERKDHARFDEIKHIEMPFFPQSVQLQGSTTPLNLTVGEAVEKGIVDNQTLGYFLARTFIFMQKIGIDSGRIRFRQHLPTEMSHYASDCWDCEIETSYGWIECVGCADRSAYDLTMHSKTTKEKLVVREKLPEPKTVQIRRLQTDKKAMGMSFKKDAKMITELLEQMSLDAIINMQSENDGNIPVISPEGKRFLVSKEMASVVEGEETLHVNEYIPNVIEPSFGIGRILYSLLEHAFWVRPGDEQRYVLSLSPLIAPTKVLVAPLSNNSVFSPICKSLQSSLRSAGLSCQLDESSTSIGRRYARNDEVGIPFALTVDFQSIDDGCVTLRERDSTEQVRLPISKVVETVCKLVEGTVKWGEVIDQFGLIQ